MLAAMTFVRVYGSRLLSWWRCALSRRELPAQITPEFAADPFTDECIAIAPNASGVYLLYRNGGLIYVGLAPGSIRRELEAHRRGEYGACTQAATAFDYEVTSDPAALQRKYLRNHVARDGGRLPPCNRRSQHAHMSE